MFDGIKLYFHVTLNFAIPFYIGGSGTQRIESNGLAGGGSVAHNHNVPDINSTSTLVASSHSFAFSCGPACFEKDNRKGKGSHECSGRKLPQKFANIRCDIVQIANVGEKINLKVLDSVGNYSKYLLA